MLSLQGLLVLSALRDVAGPLSQPARAAVLQRPAMARAHPARRRREQGLLERASRQAGAVQATGVMKRVWVVPEVTAVVRAVCHLSVLRATHGPIVTVRVVTDGQR